MTGWPRLLPIELSSLPWVVYTYSRSLQNSEHDWLWIGEKLYIHWWETLHPLVRNSTSIVHNINICAVRSFYRVGKNRHHRYIGSTLYNWIVCGENATITTTRIKQQSNCCIRSPLLEIERQEKSWHNISDTASILLTFLRIGEGTFFHFKNIISMAIFYSCQFIQCVSEALSLKFTMATNKSMHL